MDHRADQYGSSRRLFLADYADYAEHADKNADKPNCLVSWRDGPSRQEQQFNVFAVSACSSRVVRVFRDEPYAACALTVCR